MKKGKKRITIFSFLGSLLEQTEAKEKRTNGSIDAVVVLRAMSMFWTLGEEPRKTGRARRMIEAERERHVVLDEIATPQFALTDSEAVQTRDSYF